jgi:hypothetical protein
MHQYPRGIHLTTRWLAFLVASICSASPAAFAQLSSGPLNTEATRQDIQAYWQMENLRVRAHTAKAVDLYIVSPHVWYVVQLDETGLRRGGCEYQTEDPALIADLLSAIDGAHLQTTSFSLPEFEPREAIYLRLSDGSQLGLLFEGPYGTQTFLRGRAGNHLFHADRNLADQLYRWAARLKPVDKCEPFIKDYRN